MALQTHWKVDILQQLQYQNAHTQGYSGIVKDYTRLRKEYDVQSEEVVKLKTQATRGVVNINVSQPAPGPNDKVAKLEASVRDLQVKISKAYRDSALASDTFAYTSVMLRDARQTLDETTKENFELEEKVNTLEKQQSLTVHKYNITTQLAEEQQKKIIDMQNKGDALALANRNLQQQVEFLRLQATSTPFPFPNSLPNNYNFKDSFLTEPPRRRAGDDTITLGKRNSVGPGSLNGFSEKRKSTPTLTPVKTSTTPLPSPTTPTTPTSPWAYTVPPTFNNNSNSNSGYDPTSPRHDNHPHVMRAFSEPLIVHNNQTTDQGISPRSLHIHSMGPLDDDPNAANANALTAYALMAQATHARAQALKASHTSLLSSSVPANSPLATTDNGLNTSANALNGSGGVGAGPLATHTNTNANANASTGAGAGANAGGAIPNGAPALSSDSVDIRVRSVLTTSDQTGYASPDLARFNSMPNIGLKYLMGRDGFTAKMILSGRPIEAHQELNCATFHVSGEVLATGGGDHCVKVWDTSNHGGVPVFKKTMQEATSSVLNVQFSPTSSLLCGTSNDKNSYVWDPFGRELHTLSGHTEKVTCATFLMEQQLASCSWDRHIKLFDLNRGFCTTSFHLGSRMNSMCAGPFNYTICTAHHDKTIKVFDYRNGSLMHTVDAHAAVVTGVCSCPDNPTNVLTSSKDNTLKLIDLRTLEVVHTYKHAEYKNQRDINLICFSPNGKYIVAGGEEGKILFWNTQTTKIENLMTCGAKSNKCVTCVTWNPKRNQLIACHDNSLYLYDGEVGMR